MSSSSLRRNRDGKRSNKQFTSSNGMPIVVDPAGGYMHRQERHPTRLIAPRKERRRLARLNEKIEQERARKPKVNVPQAVSDEEWDGSEVEVVGEYDPGENKSPVQQLVELSRKTGKPIVYDGEVQQ